MQISLPVHTVNRYIVVYINTIAYYYYGNMINSINVDPPSWWGSSGFGPGSLQVNSVDPRGAIPPGNTCPLDLKGQG